MVLFQSVDTVKLNNGAEIPIFGLGTWLSKPGEAGAAVKHALENGYNHIDCAQVYMNEAEIGEYMSQVWKAGKVKREDIYIVSKLWCSDFAKENVIDACKLSLKNLQLDYLDLYLVHLPARLDKSVGNTICGDDRKGLIGYSPEMMKETWQEMEKLVEMGLVKSIGISNFTTKKVAELLEFAKIKPVCNQVELHPYLPQNKLVEFCKQKDIICVAYSPLGAPSRPEVFKEASHPVLLENDVVTSISKKHNATAAQVLLAWEMKRGIPVIPKSVTPSRIDQNLKSCSVKLDDEDMAKINGITIRARYLGQQWSFPLGTSVEDGWDGEYLG